VSQIVPKPLAISDRDFRRGRRRRRSARRRRRRLIRRVIVGLLIAVPVVGILTVLAVIPAAGARDHLERGREGLAKAQSALLKGDLAQALEGFTAAEGEFRQAKASGDNPLLRIPAMFPLIGRTPDAIRTISDVGLRLSDAGGEITRSIGELPGGIDALAPKDGRIPVETLQGLAPAMSRARAAFEQAEVEAQGIATTLVPQQVVEAGDLLREKLARALPPMRSADEMLRALPAFAGVEAPRHYLLGPENSAELRGTGGLLTTFSILTIDNGAISVEPFRDIKEIPSLDLTPDEWPSPELADIYGAFNAAGEARNATATLDGPTASLFLENLWNRTMPDPIDGVILVDVQALRYLVEATGAIEIPGVPYPLTERNVVQYVANDAYVRIGNDDVRKDFVGVVGQVVFQEFLQHAGGDTALRAIIRAAADGHILINAEDPQVEAAFRSAGASGALPPVDAGDFLGVAVNNTAGNKIDYYMRRHIDYDITMGPDGRATSAATVRFDNTSPADAEPGYVFGPFQGKTLRGLNLKAGEAYQSTSVYCGAGCTLSGTSRDGEPYPVQAYREGTHPLFVGVQRIPPQSTYEVRYDMQDTDVWTGNGGLGTYRLTIRSQPTLNPTTATIAIRVPEGTTIAYASEPLKISGGVATWTGELGDVTTFEVRFQKGLVGRIWGGIDDFLSKPVIRL
jgi:Protein of unknown function (DUF4012)